MYIARGEADSPRGQNFDVKRKALSLYPFVASFKEISLKSDFVFFNDLIHVYSPRAGSIQPPGDKVLTSTETSCHFSHLLLVQIIDNNRFWKIHCFIFFLYKSIFDQIWPSCKTQGHHLNKLGSTGAHDAAYQVSMSSAFWFREEDF